MTRFILSALLVLALAAPSFADVTVTATASGKGNKMPTDTVMGDTTRTMIFDVDNQRLYSFDSKKKEAEAWDMQAFGTNLNSAVDAKGQPGQAKAMAERYKLLAASSTVTSVETDAVAADLFARPAGDKIKEQK